MITNTTCPHCDHIFQGSKCPTCGYTAQQAARERVYRKTPCDFCPAPWVTQWVDFVAAGVRFVCRVHGEPSSWMADVKPRYTYAPILLESMAKERGVQVHGSSRSTYTVKATPPTPAPTMAAQVAEKLAMKEAL